jgi:enoyl-CoA hydratase
MAGEVEVERDDHAIIVTINRPERRNAINRAVAEAIAAAMDELDDDPQLRVGIITGAGPAFSAGMDLAAFGAGELPVIEGRGLAGVAERPPVKPLIAAVNGAAVAGGFELALACDLIVADRVARFGLPEVRRGLVAAGGGLLRLPRRIPHHAAVELILTGGFLDADRAYALGLVNRIAAAGEALAAARELAAEIAANAPLALVASKRIVASSVDWPSGEMFARQRAIAEPVLASADAQEGALAFLEKRLPSWRGE